MEIPSTGKRRVLRDRVDYLFHKYALRPLLQLYLKRRTQVSIGGFRLAVFRHVFHPGFFFSSRYFYSFLDRQELRDASFLEIGCGSGLLSMLAYRKGAMVTCCDIDANAVANTRHNFGRNFGAHAATIVQSDVFDGIAPGTFDYIAINPPYYFKDATVPGQQAWYCGSNGEYFRKLFGGLRNRMTQGSRAYMILGDACETERIRKLAKEAGIALIGEESRQIRWENNTIWRLVPISA